jgi:hypothetical protein
MKLLAGRGMPVAAQQAIPHVGNPTDIVAVFFCLMRRRGGRA